MFKRLFPVLVLLVFSLLSVLAQDETPPTPAASAEVVGDGANANEEECPMLVQQAIELTGQRCETTELNEACYGHIQLDAQPRIGLEPFNFTDPGDIIEVLQVQTLRLSALDVELGQWGVVLMEVAANLNGTISSEDVQILLFGDTEISDESRFVQVMATTNLNIRARPSMESAVVNVLSNGDSLIASARTEDSAWLRVRYAPDPEGLGWVSADFAEGGSDINALPVVSGEDETNDVSARFGPMQAFLFESGINDSPCSSAPESGMLIQTPEGVAAVTLRLDEVIIEMDGTAFLQAEANGDLSVSTIEGTTQLEAQGQTRVVVAGTSSTVPLDENLSPIGPPTEPAPFDPLDVANLPLELLDDEVTVPAPLAIADGQAISGQWSNNLGGTVAVCPDGTEVPFASTGELATIDFEEDSLLLSGLRYNEISIGVYATDFRDADGNLHQDTLQVISSDRINGEKILDLANSACTVTVMFQFALVSSDAADAVTS